MRNKILVICAALIMSYFFICNDSIKANETDLFLEEVQDLEEIKENVVSVEENKSKIKDEEVTSEEEQDEVISPESASTLEAINEENQEEVSEKKVVKEEQKEEKKKKKSTIQYTEEEFKILVCTMFAEGGNQPYKAKLCYANAILNRVKQKNFPNTIHGVIYHTLTAKNGKKIYQFGLAKPGGTLEKHLKLYKKRKHPLERKYEKECIKAAKAALEGENPLGDYAFFASANSPIRYQQTDGIQVNGAYFYNYHWKPWKKKK